MASSEIAAEMSKPYLREDCLAAAITWAQLLLYNTNPQEREQRDEKLQKSNTVEMFFGLMKSMIKSVKFLLDERTFPCSTA